MASKTKHRRVKSLVRELEETGDGQQQQQQQQSSSSAISISGSPSSSSLTSSSVSPPTLHTRASSSSIHSLAASFEGHARPGATTTIAASVGSTSLNRRGSSSNGNSTGHHPNSAPSTPDGQYPAASSSSYVSSTARRLDALYEGGAAAGQSNGETSLSNNNNNNTQMDEQYELEDEFLPMNSPFSPGYSMSGSMSGSTNNSPTSYRRDSLGLISPEPPASASAAERREHSRRHSRIHSRNLSVFFPRPEQAGLPGFAQPVPEESDEHDHTQVDIPVAQTRGWGFANGQQKAAAPFGTLPPPESHPNSRRGHHHRHSMSHNFFPFLDGNQNRRTSGASNLSPQHARHQHGLSTSPPDTAPLSASLNTPRSVPALSSSVASRHRHTPSEPSLIPSISSLNSKYAHYPLPIRLTLAIVFHLPYFTQLILLVSTLEIALGASLWITGQSGGSLAVTGLGYLVTFDGLAAISSVVIEGNARGTDKLWSVLIGRRSSDNAVRFPFGTSRITTMSHFAQCVYLIFSAVYTCKESVEHVLLLHGPDEMVANLGLGDELKGSNQESAAHGAAHGSMGHGEIVGHSSGGAVSGWEEFGIAIPTQLLVFSFAACLFTAIAANNHASLTEAVGPATYSLRARTSSPTSKSSFVSRILNAVFSNPFTLTVLIFTSALAASSVSLPSQQLAPLDKVMALLESIAMFYIAYPAAVATGKALLQTAPPGIESFEGDMGRLKRVMEEIENHPSVVFLPPPHIWQLNPHPPPAPALLTKPSAFGRKSLPAGASVSKEPVVTIVTVNVQVKKECTDEEILKLTNWARERCLSAVSAAASPTAYTNGVNLKTSMGPGARQPQPSSNASHQQKQVELTVQVMRFEEERALQAEVAHAHGHGHGHSHDHGHGHSHDYDHSHGSTASSHDHHDHHGYSSHTGLGDFGHSEHSLVHPPQSTQSVSHSHSHSHDHSNGHHDHHH